MIALLPFLFSRESGPAVLFWALFSNAGFAAISSAAWNPWMRDLVPQDRLGSFFGRRMSLAIAVGIAVSLAAGWYLDAWSKWFPGREVYGYSPIYFGGFLAGIVAVYFLFTIPEPKMEATAARPNLLKLLAEPFHDANFKRLVFFLGSWNFAVNLAAPFFTVYMLRRLGFSMSLVIVLIVLSQITNFIFLRVWGRLSDRLSHKSILRVSGPLFIACILAWTFTTMPEKHALTVPLLVVIHALMGASTAGVTLASGNIGLKLAPKGQATAYLAATSVTNSLAAGIAPILGGRFVDFFAGSELSWTLRWTSPGSDLALRTLDFQHWDFFFFFAFLLGLFSIHRLGRVKEVGEVEERIVVNELMAEMRRRMGNLSTAGGLRRMVLFPFALVRYSGRARNNHRNGRTDGGLCHDGPTGAAAADPPPERPL